ncbi:MAG: HAD-IA family hydrolase [Deltaproteobacteria bacterium]|nr:HAD-IA family hydrolase [Deltaproteobacteria bacterium]MDQ3300742.1 HAD-IA family hydrolase [Myxococcota bacterium]
MTDARPPLAILFDLDGTLVDSLEDIAVALDLALADHGIARPTREMVRTWIGGGARNLIAHAVEPALVEPVLARFGVHYRAAPHVHSRLYAGLEPVLDQLVAAGIRLAILSNKPHDLTVPIAAALLGRWPFEIVAGQRAGVPLKPSPESALAIASLLGVAPADCTFVGDSAIDILTAHAAGMRAVAVTWGFRPRAELVDASPAIIVDEPAQLAALLR